MFYKNCVYILIVCIAYESSILESAVHKKLNKLRYTWTPSPIEAPLNCTYDDGWHCYSYEPSQPPKTIIGNMIIAIAGGATTTIGALFAAVGCHLIKDAIRNNGNNSTQNPLEPIIDGFGGAIFGSFGIMFALIGLQAMGVSIARIYNILHNVPLPESSY